MLFGTTRNEARRKSMLASIAPIWDGNETWLIVAGVVLWGAFPIVYSTLLGAFYIPVCVMLAGLIFRGVSFEFRVHAHRSKPVWDCGLVVGSLVATFMQGAMIGALAEGLPIENGRFMGNDMSWLSPFSVVAGIALCFGYMLLGAGWLAKKCEGETRDAAFRAIPRLLVVVLVLLIALFFTRCTPILRSWRDGRSVQCCSLYRSLLIAVLIVWHGARRRWILRYSWRPQPCSWWHMDVRRLVLAVHRAVLITINRGCCADVEPVVHVLGAGSLSPIDAGLHPVRLPSSKARLTSRPSIIEALRYLTDVEHPQSDSGEEEAGHSGTMSGGHAGTAPAFPR